MGRAGERPHPDPPSFLSLPQILEPLRLACAGGDPRIVEPALSCLHKLVWTGGGRERRGRPRGARGAHHPPPRPSRKVSHAYLQSESTPHGALNDGTPATRVVAAAAAAAARPGAPPPVALAALRALLTACTADHLVPHGDALLAAVRAQFGAALGGGAGGVGAAARGALAQTLAAALARVTQRPLSRDGSAADLVVGTARARWAPGDGGHLGASAPSGDGAAAVAAAPAPAPTATATAAEPGPATPRTPPSTAPTPAAPGASSAPGAAPPELDAAMGTARAAQLASLAERGDVAAVAAALDALQAERGNEGEEENAAVAAAATPRAATAAAPPPSSSSATPPRPWHPPRRGLSLAERDLVLLISSVCGMAAADAGGGGDPAAAAARALASDLLLRLLDAPADAWDGVSASLADALRVPLSRVLLAAAAAPPGSPAAAAGAALLAAALRARPLRAALKAEVGAFYPLLVLRPAEGDWWADAATAAGAAAALRAARAALARPQALVDLFVNFDCDLHAANLVERTLKAAARAAGRAGVGGGATPADAASAAGAAALATGLASLDAWAAPLADADARDRAGGGPALEPPTPSARPPSASSLASADGAAALAEVAPPLPRRPTADGEAAAFAAAKERKHSLAAGVAVFNRDPAAGVRALVAAGCVPPDPAALAAFLKAQGGAVDPTALGVLFGSPDPAAQAVLRAHAAAIDYRGLPLDAALRSFLSGFRLPGEAQQIDRIVQTFADAYAAQQQEQNKGGGSAGAAPSSSTLASADAAYLVAFALVMLNTDAHHPAAPASLTRADFAGMCEAAVGGGLDRGELDAMFDRVTAEEIAPPGTAAAAPVPSARRAGAASRLAAALGLPGAAARSGWDKGAASAAERARALAAARAALDAGGGAAHLWHTATQAEHARPILMAGGGPAVAGLAAAARAAADAAAAAPHLAALATAARLGALLGLDSLVEAAISALAASVGLDAPPVRGAPRESVGVAALAALLGVAAGPAAAGLGGGWVPVLRSLSGLDELCATSAAAGGGGGGDDADAPPSPTTAAPTPAGTPADGSPARVAGGGLAGGPAVAAAVKAAAVAAGAPLPPPPPPPPSTSRSSTTFSRLFGAVGLGDGVSADGAPAAPGRHTGPGAALADWALSPPGAAAVASVLDIGPTLGGEGGVVYARALAAVSTEEQSATPPRVWALAALAAAALTAARGVRAHAARVWAVAGAALAAAACSGDARAADAAVAALGRLADALLPRGAAGGCALPAADLLKPFEAAARGGATADVRRAAVDAAARALATHGRRLPPPAWAAALRVLAAGATDVASPGVVSAALDGAGAAVDALSGAGAATCAAAADGLAACFGAAARNPGHEQLSIAAAFGLQALARLLADEEGGEGDADASATPSTTPWDATLAALATVARHDPRPMVADAAAAALFEVAADVAPRWRAAGWRAFGGHAVRYCLDLPARPTDAPPSDAAAAPRAVGWSAEGAARLVRHARAHARTAAALVAAHLPASRPALRPLLSLIVRFCLAPDGRVAAAGADALEGALAALLPTRDGDAWASTLAAASAASRGDVLAGLAADDGGGGAAPGADAVAVGSGAATPLGGLPPAPDAATTAGAARTRARSALLAQRALAGALERVGAAAPPDRATALAALLEASVARAAVINRDADARAAAAALLSGDDWDGEKRAANDGDDADPPDPWADPPAPALVRQQTEGGALLLATLRRLDSGGGRVLAAARAALARAPPRAHPPNWDDDAVGALLMAALDAAAAAPAAAWASSAAAGLGAELAALARDGRPAVRAALAALLDARLAPLLLGASA